VATAVGGTLPGRNLSRLVGDEPPEPAPQGLGFALAKRLILENPANIALEREQDGSQIGLEWDRPLLPALEVIIRMHLDSDPPGIPIDPFPAEVQRLIAAASVRIWQLCYANTPVSRGSSSPPSSRAMRGSGIWQFLELGEDISCE